jgi:hypothetical protein
VAEEEIPYGLRRAPLAIVVFGAGGAGFVWWSRAIDEPTFLFPLGRVEPETGRVYLFVVALACFAYLATLLYVRYVKKPRVHIGDGEVTLVLGEFGSQTQTLRQGDVLGTSETRTRGGWRTLHVQHESGELLVHSARLPDDAAYERVCEALRGLVRSGKRKGKKARRDADE